MKKKDYGLEEFYTQQVVKIEDVQSLETFVVCKGYNLKAPCILQFRCRVLIVRKSG